MPDEPDTYHVEAGNRVRRFLRRHPDLNAQWQSQILNALITRPLQGPQIVHMKGRFSCSRRWRVGTYRILYDVNEEGHRIRVYDVDVRGDIYRPH